MPLEMVTKLAEQHERKGDAGKAAQIRVLATEHYLEAGHPQLAGDVLQTLQHKPFPTELKPRYKNVLLNLEKANVEQGGQD